jgi:outer membrane protein assembly factor BamB
VIGLLVAGLVSGTVFADLDGDGLYSTGDEPLAGVAVVWETTVWGETNGAGHYSLDTPGAGIVWVRVPDGYRPGPVWKAVPSAGDGTADLAVAPATATGPLTFVHASDTHIGATTHLGGAGVDRDATARALDQAAAMVPAPHFLTITGDITSGNETPQFEDLAAVVAGLDVPFVPVIGNHDRYDGGGNYRRFLGPGSYSFDAGGVHVVVLDFSMTTGAMMDFLAADLALTPADRPVAAFLHAPMPDWVEPFRDAGVDFVFSGHWHSNRVIDHGGMVEVNTETLVMGGIDFTPGGYRVVTIDGGPSPILAMTHHTTLESVEPLLAVVHPRPGECIDGDRVEVIAAAEAGPSLRRVLASVDGGAAVPLDRGGGWTFRGALDLTGDARDHDVRLTLEYGEAATATVQSLFCRESRRTVPLAILPWPQLQGGPSHTGFSEVEIAPPLRTLWATSVGGHLRGGSAVLADGRLYVPVVDLADGSGGGVVALDARTGAVLWERRTGWSVHNAPAVADGIVVFGSAEGVVHAVDAATGAAIWSLDLGEGLSEMVSWLYAAPTIADGIVYIGVQRRFAAVDLGTGTILWEVDPSPTGAWLGSFSSAAVGAGIVMATFSRGGDGVVAWDAYDGEELWRLPPPHSLAVNASPIVSGDRVYLGNAATLVYGMELATSSIEWQRQLVAGPNDWAYGVASTPALADGRLFVPTQYEFLFALDAGTGAEDWRHAVGMSTVHPAHYQASAKTFTGSPVVTGEILWIGGGDGLLRALDASTGQMMWSTDLGAPILSGPVPAGFALYVGTWDGTMRALVAPEAIVVEPTPPQGSADGDDASPGDGGCGCGLRGGSRREVGTMLLLLIVVVSLRRRR